MFSMIQEDRKELFKYALGATALILLIQTLLAAYTGIFDGLLHDVNCYSWLTRVLQLHETGEWFNARIPRIDPPYGLEQHWTRPFDVLLFIGAWIGAPLVGFKNALYYWGILISPMLQVLALIAFFWALLPLFSNILTALKNGVIGRETSWPLPTSGRSSCTGQNTVCIPLRITASSAVLLTLIT
jgi:hypothetical protein